MTAIHLQWRRFNFFDREVAKDPTSPAEPFEKLKTLEVACIASGRGSMLVGDTYGHLHMVDRNLEVTSFQMYELATTHLFQLKRHNILVSVGRDEEGVNPMVKVWNFEKLNQKGEPTCVRVFRALSGNKAVDVTCLSVCENLSQMALGFEDGSVCVIKGDITSQRQSKSRVIHQDRYAITGLAYKQLGTSMVLFVTTSQTVCSYDVAQKDRKEQLDEHGAELNCSAISDGAGENHFMIAKNEALYFYQQDGRGPCLAFEGEKRMATWFRGYLIVVSVEGQRKMPVKKTGLSSVGPSAVNMNIVTIYDIDNKFIAYTAPFPEVQAVVSEWGSLHVVTKDGKLFHLQEKDTQTKLETLFRKNMYDMAISLAKSQHYSDGLVEIFRQYGDHLYSKGNHDGAIQQYIRTIGQLEPSYVIRKFLDAQRIHNLTEYLQALHEKGMANTDHTTLLLNCYTKLKAVDKLSEFISADDKELTFDVETAIRVCRQAGYFTHALDLSEKFAQHDWYLRIQLEDIKDYKKALRYISKLPFLQAESNMKNYGKLLVNSEPEESTQFLMNLCTDYQPLQEVATSEPRPSSTKALRSHPDDFIHIFVHQKLKLREFLEYMVQSGITCSNVVYNTLLELYLQESNRLHQEGDFVPSAEQENKALDLLTSTEAKYDLDHAMVLAQVHNFKRGILFLYEKTKAYQQILRYHMERNDYEAIVDDCQKYGTKDQGLWSQALSYFAKKEDEAVKPFIIDVLDHIDKFNLMSPLLVVETLAHNSHSTLDVVKDYILKRLRHENEQIAKDEQQIRQYREDTDKMRTQIEELRTSAKMFQSSKCMICSRPLELPAVHFLCGDSFHHGCFESYSDGDGNECPICAPENRKVMDMIRAQEHNRDLHEQFNHQLERSADGFSVVADYFGRGVFNKVTLYTDPQTNQTVQSVASDHAPQSSRQKRDSLLK